MKIFRECSFFIQTAKVFPLECFAVYGTLKCTIAWIKYHFSTLLTHDM